MKIVSRNLIVMLTLAFFCAFTTVTVEAANTTNKAWSVEYFTTWWYYDGTIQFVPSYVIPDDAGYSLKEGKRVKQAYINYTRKVDGKDTSIIGGRKYTELATNKKSKSLYTATATAKDSWNIFTNQTRFWYGWYYF